MNQGEIIWLSPDNNNLPVKGRKVIVITSESENVLTASFDPAYGWSFATLERFSVPSAFTVLFWSYYNEPNK